MKLLVLWFAPFEENLLKPKQKWSAIGVKNILCFSRQYHTAEILMIPDFLLAAQILQRIGKYIIILLEKVRSTS